MGWNEQAYRGSRTVVTTFALALLVAVGCGAAGEEAPGGRSRGDTPRAGGATVSTRTPPAGHAWVIFGADTVVAEVAATNDERAEGLMYRDEVPDGTGMLFVFQNSEVRSFWMANTYVALDIAYMDANYTVVDIIAMEPLVTDSYPSQAPAMFALEVRQGWFEQEGIAIGAQAVIEFGVQRRRLN
jgi:uncharacterized membrane protein (UPF0127 family)